MQSYSFPLIAAISLSIIFGAAAVVHLAGPGFVQRAYARWEFPPKFYRVTGLVELLACAFLATGPTRIWGVVLAGLVTFVGEITLLNHRQYAWSIPGIMVLIALVPASLASGI